ncbi:hypothetical protein RSAG8_02403, partial [Rhizoctonia solani AG-8 WAC10335]
MIHTDRTTAGELVCIQRTGNRPPTHSIASTPHIFSSLHGLLPPPFSAHPPHRFSYQPTNLFGISVRRHVECFCVIPRLDRAWIYPGCSRSDINDQCLIQSVSPFGA